MGGVGVGRTDQKPSAIHFHFSPLGQRATELIDSCTSLWSRRRRRSLTRQRTLLLLLLLLSNAQPVFVFFKLLICLGCMILHTRHTTDRRCGKAKTSSVPFLRSQNASDCNSAVRFQRRKNKKNDSLRYLVFSHCSYKHLVRDFKGVYF